MISETEYRIAREKFESAVKDFDFVFHSPFAWGEIRLWWDREEGLC